MAELERDPDLSRRYAGLPREEPPPELDAAILAASRRSGKRRWYVPVALAAILVLAVAVTVQVERERPEGEIARVSPPASEKPLPAPEIERKDFARKPSLRSTGPQPDLQAAKPVEPPAAAPESKVADVLQEHREAASAAGAPAAPPASTAKTRVQARALANIESPEQALEHITALRKEGKDDEADKALAEFRKRYPDYRIPETMRERVERK